MRQAHSASTSKWEVLAMLMAVAVALLMVAMGYGSGLPG